MMMDITSSIDCKSVISSTDPLLGRLEVVKDCFTQPIEVSIGIQEDDVLVWLTRLVTTKATELSPEDLEASWISLGTILNSSRIEALSKSGWSCLFSSSFIETLISIATCSESPVQEHAIKIVYTLMKNQQLSSLLTHQPRYCFVLLEGIGKWILDGHRDQEDIDLAVFLTEELNSYMKHNIDKTANLLSTIEYLLMTDARLQVALKKDESRHIQMFLNELNSVVYQNVVNDSTRQMYLEALLVFFCEETKVSLPDTVGKIFECLTTAIKSESLEVSQYVVYQFLNSFLLTYKNSDDKICKKMIIVMCFMIGVTVKGSGILKVSNNNFACQQILISDLSFLKRESLLLSVLQAMKEILTKYATTLDDIAQSAWLKNLRDFIIKEMFHTATSIQCLQMIMQINPKKTAYFVIKNFNTIVCSSHINTEITDPLSHALDDLLCDVLQVYEKLREIPSMFVEILHSLLENPKTIGSCSIIPETLHIYEGKLFFPPKFMFTTMNVFHGLGHTNVIATWTVFLTLMTEDVAKLLEKAQSLEGNRKLIGMSLWLLSCILRAFPILDVMNVPDVSQRIAKLMSQTATEVIKPFFAAMLTLHHDNDIVGSLLILCHTWGEIHTNLCSFNKYLEHSDLSSVQVPNISQEATDFSYLLPFISSDMWAQVSARISNFADKPTQLAQVQLVVQKFSHVIRYHESISGIKMSPARKQMEIITKYLLNVVKLSNGTVMELVIVHFSYLLQYIPVIHMSTIAKYLVDGFLEGKQCWIDFVNSDHFLEARQLHPHVIQCICSTLASGLESRKRKLSQSDSSDVAETPKKKNHAKKLFAKMADAKPFYHKNYDNLPKEEDKNDVILHEELCLIFGKLVNSQSKGPETSVCIRYLDTLLRLLKRCPFNFINTHSQTLMLFILLTTLVNDCFEKKEDMLDLVNTLTGFLIDDKSPNLLKGINIDVFLKWLIKKRLSMSMSAIVNIKGYSMNTTDLLKQPEATQQKLDQLDDAICQEFDALIKYVFENKDCSKEECDTMLELAQFITASEELPQGEEDRLNIAVLLLSVNQKRMRMPEANISSKQRRNTMESNKSCFKHLSRWIMQLLKKSDLATIQPSTAASFLMAHAIILEENARVVNRKEKKQDSNITDHLNETADTTDLNVTVDENMPQITTTKEKVPKCLKYLNYSLKLSHLCYSGDNQQLWEHVLNFYTVIGKYSSHVESHLTSDFFPTTWSLLLSKEKISESYVLKKSVNRCLMSLLALSSKSEFEQLLKDLLRDTQSQQTVLSSLAMWKIIIPINVSQEKTASKRVAVEHLIPLIVNQVTLLGKSMGNILFEYVETIRLILKKNMPLPSEARGLILKFSTVVPLSALPLFEFRKVFISLGGIMQYLLNKHSDFVLDRVPSLQAVIGSLLKALVIRSSVENTHMSLEIKYLVECSNSLERLVARLLRYRPALKRVIHFTLADLVMAMQSTIVNKEIKTVLETIAYHLIDICNEFSLEHLLVTLPEENITLLKHLQYNYKNFYKYRSNKYH